MFISIRVQGLNKAAGSGAASTAMAVPLFLKLKKKNSTKNRQGDSRKKQMLSHNLTTYHRRSTKNQTPNQEWQILGLGFLHTSRGPFASPRDSLESPNLSSEASVLHGLTTWRRLHYVEDEDTVIFHIRGHRTHQMATLMLDAAFITNGYTNWKDATQKKVGFSQHETWPVSPGTCRPCHDQGCRRAHIISPRRG